MPNPKVLIPEPHAPNPKVAQGLFLFVQFPSRAFDQQLSGNLVFDGMFRVLGVRVLNLQSMLRVGSTQINKIE